MLSHILANDPRVGYAHQSNLIGPATVNGSDSGYTLLSLLNSMLAQYNAWTTTPLIQTTDATDAQTLGLQSAWAKSAGSVTATELSTGSRAKSSARTSPVPWRSTPRAMPMALAGTSSTTENCCQSIELTIPLVPMLSKACMTPGPSTRIQSPAQPATSVVCTQPDHRTRRPR